MYFIYESFNYNYKRKFKALFLIHQCVDGDNFGKVGYCKSSKQAWEFLEKAYTGVDKAKVVRLNTHKRQLELIQMEEKETINNFTIRITRLVNQVKACREAVTEQCVVTKISRFLTPKFDIVVVAIEKLKNLTTMRKKGVVKLS